jgi:hypothetical protein
VTGKDQLDEEDRIKLDTWFQVMALLEHYRGVTFEPMYARGRRMLASAEDKQILAAKLEIIRKRQVQLQERWEKALGPNWRDALEQD